MKRERERREGDLDVVSWLRLSLKESILQSHLPE